MKLIIDIPEREYKVICENNYVAVCACPNLLSNAIKNGTPIPDNATNGDVIKVMFSNTEIMITDERVFLRDGTIVMIYPLTWWNAPYQKGGTTRKNCEYRHENGNCLKVGGFCTSVDNEHCVKGGKE